MSDSISRQAAIDALGNGALVNYQAAGHNNGLVKAIDVIKGLPSAQPEIVIPCIGCANWIPGFITDNDDFVPPKCGKYQQMVGHDSNDFCSFAERRTDGTD